MIGYTTIGTNDFEAALEYYDRLLETIGMTRLWSHGNMAAWGRSRSEPAFCVAKPHNGERASVGNGAMIALKVASKKEVDAMHAKSLELGGSNEGDPGPRGEHGFYGGYFRDLDGNKLNCYVPG